MEQTTEIKGYKNGSLLMFERENKTIAFDLKDLSFYRPLQKGKMRKLNAGQSFFRNITAKQVADGFNNPAYAELMNKVRQDSYRLKNFASLFEKLAKYTHLESYLLLGIRFGATSTFSKPASQFPKQVLEFMKESQIEFSSSYWEHSFQKNPELLTNLCTYVRRRHYLDLEVYRMVYHMCGSYNSRIEKFKLLTDTQVKEMSIADDYYGRRNGAVLETPYGCEYKTLFDYLVMIDRTEALSFGDALTQYHDYLKMMREMERNKAISKMLELNPTLDVMQVGWVGFGRIEKYPRYLRTRHDIVQKNYQVWSNSVDEKRFSLMVEHRYEYAWGGYRIVTPKKSADIRNEGTSLHHCVASYVSRVMDGTTQIVFLRTDENESLVTVEIRANAIVQSRGYNNRSIDEKEERWLKTFAKAKNLNYKDVKRDETMPTPPIVAMQKWDVNVATLRELSKMLNG